MHSHFSVTHASRSYAASRTARCAKTSCCLRTAGNAGPSRDDVSVDVVTVYGAGVVDGYSCDVCGDKEKEEKADGLHD